MARTSIEMPALQMHWTWFDPHLPIVEFINCPITTSQSHSVILPSCMLEGQTGNTYIVLHPSMSSLERERERERSREIERYDRVQTGRQIDR